MIVKDLIKKCSVYNVTKTIAHWAKVNEKDFSDLLQRCTKLLDELGKIDDYWICDDKDFCFAGCISEREDIPDVILTSDASKLEDNGWEQTKDISSYDWSWGDFLGLTVYDKSIEKYGIDVLLGKVLYRLMYYDYSEDEVRKIRIPLEVKKNIKQIDLYKNLMRQIYVINYKKSKILDLIPSEEIRKCVDKSFEKLSSNQINSIICGSLTSLEDKLLVLSELKKVDEIYDNTYKAINNALSMLKLNENEIFILKGQGVDEADSKDEKKQVRTHEYFPINSCQTAIHYIKNSCRVLLEYNKFEEIHTWFVLEKWALDESGMYKKVINYYITLKGDIWLYEFDYGYQNEQGRKLDKSTLLENIDIYAGLKNIEIPTPHKFGDIYSWMKVVCGNEL